MNVAPTVKKVDAALNEVPSLNQLYFYLTAGCNLACRHCWLAPKYDPAGTRYPTLQVELFEMAVTEAKPLGLSTVKLTGGEPLLHPQIKKFLKIVRREQLALVIETNGVLCTREMAGEIARSPGCSVSVSLDGADAATHEWVRGIKGSFDLARRAIKNLVAVGITTQIIMSVMHCNVNQIEAMVHLAEELGASSLKFNIIQPTGRGEKISTTANGLEVSQLIDLGSWVDADLTPTTGLELHFDYPLAFRPLSRLAKQDGARTCGILGILGVIPSGHYALCGIGEHLPDLVFGRVGVDPLSGVWRRHALLNRLRTEVPEHIRGICSRCLMRNQCLGACVAQNYYRTGDLLAPFWFCQQAAAEGLFPETRLTNL